MGGLKKWRKAHCKWGARCQVSEGRSGDEEKLAVGCIDAGRCWVKTPISDIYIRLVFPGPDT